MNKNAKPRFEAWIKKTKAKIVRSLTPVWDGDRNNLPGKGVFIYRETLFATYSHNDGSQVAINLDSNRMDSAMTIRMFGGHMGLALFDVMIKSSVATPESLAEIVELNATNHNEAQRRYTEYIDQLEKLMLSMGLMEFNRNFGVTVEESLEVGEMYLNRALMKVMRSSGVSDLRGFPGSMFN